MEIHRKPNRLEPTTSLESQRATARLPAAAPIGPRTGKILATPCAHRERQWPFLTLQESLR